MIVAHSPHRLVKAALVAVCLVTVLSCSPVEPPPDETVPPPTGIEGTVPPPPKLDKTMGRPVEVPPQRPIQYLDAETITMPGEVVDLSVAASSFAVSCTGPNAGAYVYDSEGSRRWSVEVAFLLARTPGQRPVEGESLDRWQVTSRVPVSRIRLAEDGGSLWFQQHEIIYRVEPNRLLEFRTAVQEDWRVSPTGNLVSRSAAVFLPNDRGLVTWTEDTIHLRLDEHGRLDFVSKTFSYRGSLLQDGVYASPTEELILAVDSARKLILAIDGQAKLLWEYKLSPLDIQFTRDGRMAVMLLDGNVAVWFDIDTIGKSRRMERVVRIVDVGPSRLALLEIDTGSTSILSVVDDHATTIATLDIEPRGTIGGFDHRGNIILAVPGGETVYVFRAD